MIADAAYDFNSNRRRYATAQNLAFDPAYDPDYYDDPAYDSAYEPAYDPAYEPEYDPDRYRRPDISVVPGTGNRSAAQTLSPAVRFGVGVAIAVLLAFSLLGFLRITLFSATTAVGLEAQEYTNQLDAARSQTSDLEITLASLSNPVRIKSEATDLGMESAGSAVLIDLTNDVVVTDSNGALSLSGSVAALASNTSDSQAVNEQLASQITG